MCVCVRCAVEEAFALQGGEDPIYVDIYLNISLSAKELYIYTVVARFRKMICNLRHPMCFRHPVATVSKAFLYEILLL